MRASLIPHLAFLIVAAPAVVSAQETSASAEAAVVAAASPILAYQGQLQEGGTPVTGSRNFQFEILSSGNAVLWNSGVVAVTVTGGLYGVELGGAGMPAIAASVLAQTRLKLQIAVGGSVLSPNVDLVPAFQASSAFQLTGTLAGDVGGTQNATVLLRLQGFPLDLTTTAPRAGQVLSYTGTKWVAGTVLGTQGPVGPA